MSDNIVIKSGFFTQISEERFGSFIIIVNSLIKDGPTAVFSVSKCSEINEPSISKLSRSGPEHSEITIYENGPTVHTLSETVNLNIQWLPYSGIKLYKDNDDITYDGLYSVKII